MTSAGVDVECDGSTPTLERDGSERDGSDSRATPVADVR